MLRQRSLIKPGCCRTVLNGGGDTGGAGGDAGLHSLSYPAVGASYSHYVAVIYCDSDGIRSDTDSGYESGVVKFWYRPALVPLLIFTSDSKLMGDLVNSKRVKQTGWVIVVLVVALNIWLLVGTALGL